MEAANYANALAGAFFPLGTCSMLKYMSACAKLFFPPRVDFESSDCQLPSQLHSHNQHFILHNVVGTRFEESKQMQYQMPFWSDENNVKRTIVAASLDKVGERLERLLK
ncbi:hypothetical protein AMTR_s00039p00124610 [Amborella trichopoda]|uniref:Uncharacterized protein n=1 Tax=Amborella trichopoda TaxID=13333 RepID=U5D300_AMBTC|nr:hypothetical protein AMTR_s00039p00124610 [Amborella trichopoda]